MARTRFPAAHATHPQWPFASALVLAQLRAQMALPGCAARPALGLIYITPHYAPHAEAILAALSDGLPEATDWAGAVGVGVCASGAEYWDEPAISVLLCDLPPPAYRVFSGVAPLGGSRFAPHTALVHADARTPDAGDLVAELAARTASGSVFGGLATSRGRTVQFAVSSRGVAPDSGALAPHSSGVFTGGLSGVSFSAGVPLVTRVSHGCQPVAPLRRITAARDNVILELDGEPALDVLLDDLDVTLDAPHAAVAALRRTLVGLTDADADVGAARAPRRGPLGPDVTVRPLIGLDPLRRGVAIAEACHVGQRAALCMRDPRAARGDLMRICAEIREQLEPADVAAGSGADTLGPDAAERATASRIRGALYVSCANRGGAHFGGPSAELQIVRHALGDVPLAGFFAGGEIADGRIHGYTGVLTVFVGDD